MEIVDLLALFSDPTTIKELSGTQRLLAGLVTTLLGMGITFLALVVLQVVTGFFSKLAPPEKKETKELSSTVDARAEDDREPATQPVADQAELIAAITTALALMLDKPSSEIVITSIKTIDNPVSAWSRAGIAEQVHNSV